MSVPATKRFLNKDKALGKFTPSLVEALDANILKTDELADAVVAGFDRLPKGKGWAQLDQALANGMASLEDPLPELEALFAQLDNAPAWVDFEQLKRGSIAYWRAGYFTGLALSCASLAAGYRSSSAVMPLILTGRLVDRAEKRKIETGQWLLRASSPGNMGRDQPGFAFTVRVRLIHAFVRRRLMQLPEWDYEAWGAPINLTDTAYGISGEFSSVAIDAMQKCGLRYSKQEREDMYALWRYVGYVLGVPEELLPCNEQNALEQMEIKELTDTKADDNSRALVKALIENGGDDRADLAAIVSWFISKKRFEQFLYGQVRYFAGDDIADELGVPNSAWKHTLKVIRPLVSISELIRSIKPDPAKDERRSFEVIGAGLSLLKQKTEVNSLADTDQIEGDISTNREKVFS